MKEKIPNDVFREAFMDFFAKKKTANEDGAVEGAVSDQYEAPGERNNPPPGAAGL
jgi:hypothetical protein